MAQDVPAAGGTRLIPPAALAHVPGCENGAQAQAVAALGGGTVNESFRVDTNAGCFVLRLNATRSTFLGADHAREARLQAAAAEYGLSPPVIYSDPAHAFMITQFVPGRVWEASDMASPEALHRLAARLRALHAVPAPAVAAFDLGAILRRYGAQLAVAAPAGSARVLGLVEQSEATLARCAGAGRKGAIVHNDLHCSNVIEAERLYLIDWEYAAVADPIFDLGCLLAYYPQAEPHAQDLLETAGLARDASLAELQAARSLFVLLSFLWYRIRRLTGETASDADVTAESALLRRLGT